MTEYIEPEQAMAVVVRLGFRIRDEGLLFSALARPSASMFGDDAYGDLYEKAAALASSLAQNHPLTDGNKRLSLYLTFAFLRINGVRMVMSNDEAFDLIMAAAQSRLDVPAIAARLRDGSTPSS